jgi:hypothetical protein
MWVDGRAAMTAAAHACAHCTAIAPVACRRPLELACAGGVQARRARAQGSSAPGGGGASAAPLPPVLEGRMHECVALKLQLQLHSSSLEHVAWVAALGRTCAGTSARMCTGRQNVFLMRSRGGCCTHISSRGSIIRQPGLWRLWLLRVAGQCYWVNATALACRPPAALSLAPNEW